MLLGEPPRSPYDLNFWVLGVPVRVHPLFWPVALVLGMNLRDVASVLTWIIAVFLSILMHELGHAAAMRAWGFRPWIVLYGFGGQTAYDQAFAYRSAGSGALGQVLISAAGPAAGFMLAGLVRLLFHLVQSGYLAPSEIVLRLLDNVYFICVVWGMVNLLPVYPLDGGHIAREILLKINPRQGIRWSLGLSIVAAAGMAGYGLLQWGSWFVALLFGYLAYGSYGALVAYRARGPW